MGQNSVCDNKATSTIADERIGNDRNLNNKRFVRPYKDGDVALLLKELDLGITKATVLARDIDFNVKHGTSYTVIANNKIISIAGVIVLREGIGESWSLVTGEIKNNAKFYFKSVKWGIRDGFEKFNLRRMQTICRSDDPISYNWQKRLGFEFEGIMKAYNDDGTNAIRMAMTWFGKQKTHETSLK